MHHDPIPKRIKKIKTKQQKRQYNDKKENRIKMKKKQRKVFLKILDSNKKSGISSIDLYSKCSKLMR